MAAMSDMESSKPSGGKPVRRWLGPALLVSLVINLFLGGLIATAIIKHRDGPPPGGHPSFFGAMRGDMADLSKEDRDAMRKIMVGQFKTIRPHLVEMDAARKKLAEAVGAMPYDPAKVAAVFAEIDMAQTEMGRTMRDAMIKGFGEMSDAQRQRLSAAMLKNANRPWRRKGKDGKEGKEGDDDLPPPPDGFDGPEGHGGPDGGPDGPPPF
jgi:uncharacterized membrane protein